MHESSKSNRICSILFAVTLHPPGVATSALADVGALNRVANNGIVVKKNEITDNNMMLIVRLSITALATVKPSPWPLFRFRMVSIKG